MSKLEQVERAVLRDSITFNMGEHYAETYKFTNTTTWVDWDKRVLILKGDRGERMIPLEGVKHLSIKADVKAVEPQWSPGITQKSAKLKNELNPTGAMEIEEAPAQPAPPKEAAPPPPPAPKVKTRGWGKGKKKTPKEPEPASTDHLSGPDLDDGE